MLTSFAPSPIANVTSCVDLLIKSTTCALFLGVARQQITVLQIVASSRKCFRHSGDNIDFIALRTI